DGPEVGQRAVVGLERAQILEAQLVARVGQPALAETLPGQDVDAPRAEQAPHGHFEGAGVGAGDDADAIVVGQAEQRARAVEYLGETRLAGRRAVGAADQRVLERRKRPPRALGGRSRSETRVRWTMDRRHGARLLIEPAASTAALSAAHLTELERQVNFLSEPPKRQRQRQGRWRRREQPSGC